MKSFDDILTGLPAERKQKIEARVQELVKQEKYKRGWGLDYSVVDKLFDDFKKRYNLADEKYHNYYPFKSQSGKWYAFHNQSYGDIRIIHLETGLVVVDKFYSNGKIYGQHTNASTYVPSYMTRIIESNNQQVRTSFPHIDMDYELEADDSNVLMENIQFLPYAFNAWTLWAADFEFYVDILDISRIDEGIVKMVDRPSLTIPRDFPNVRDLVKVSGNLWIPTAESINKELKHFSFDFQLLVEEYKDRVDFTIPNKMGSIRDMHNETNSKYPLKQKLPWEELRDRLDANGIKY